MWGRRYDLDWLRVFAFGVLIFYHVGMFYVTWDWIVKSRYSAPFLEPVMGLTNPWRLALLFFISGAAVRFAIDKTTLGIFLPERFTRLLVPLAFGMAVICVPQAYAELRYLGEIEPGFFAFYRDYLGYGDFSIVAPPWYHLWYVAYILVYTLIAVACLPLLRPAATAFGGSFVAWLARGRAWRLLFVPALPFAAYAVTLDPYFPTTLALWGDWANIAQTLTFFLIGFAAAKSEDFWNAVDRTLPASIFLSLVLGGLLLTALLNQFAVGSDLQLLNAVLLLREFYAWSIIVMLLGLGRRFANCASPTLTHLNSAIFPYYILHQTIIVLVGYWFTVNEASVAIEATTMVGATVIGCILGYEVLRRVPALRPLFGLPKRRRRAEA
ncbi:acyltransferase family protein [Mesorhizobium sp. KR9-304]|uniref:acyltransferase family protein n=1 Tax=Mesorhizobium sp. KR9-304 TaxID=3156614 RepID=UPI0032B5B4E1